MGLILSKVFMIMIRGVHVKISDNIKCYKEETLNELKCHKLKETIMFGIYSSRTYIR